ncbi:polysialyltransferase family glycosyltransferase [Hathewaya histolytica]|uniref:polysialyltransferase family glycosyltransferase n=1 Tax=Hathewaya histolytica TaxID=1498 RepID=UPI003B66EF0D
MKNLFLVYTPYHLILATTIVIGQNCEEQNDLIIMNTFDTNKLDLNSINFIFNRVVIVDKKNNLESFVEKIKNNLLIINQIKVCIKETKYNYVYLCHDDTPIDQKTIDICLRNNSQCKFIYLEDGSFCYCDYETIKPKGKIQQSIKEVICKTVFGIKDAYEFIEVLGTHSKLDHLRLLWPEFARKELKSKPIHEIERELLLSSINKVYSNKFKDVHIKNNSIIILLELFDARVMDFKKYSDLIYNIVNYSKMANINVYIKYHPREVNRYMDYIKKEEYIIFLDKDAPAEVLCSKALDKKVYIISLKSTSLYTLIKMSNNIKVISLINVLGFKDNNFTVFFNKLGMIMPSSFEELCEDLNDLGNEKF